MPSADFYATIGSLLSFLSLDSEATAQISRGKFDRLHRTPAGSTRQTFDGYGLCKKSVARPTWGAYYPVSVRQVTVLLHASFRRTPHDDALALR